MRERGHSSTAMPLVLTPEPRLDVETARGGVLQTSVKPLMLKVDVGLLVLSSSL